MYSTCPSFAIHARIFTIILEGGLHSSFKSLGCMHEPYVKTKLKFSGSRSRFVSVKPCHTYMYIVHIHVHVQYMYTMYIYNTLIMSKGEKKSETTL